MAERPGETPEQRDPGEPGRATAPAKPKPPTWIAMSGLGFEFVAAVLLPGALGWWLDRVIGSSPWIMLAGGILGFVVGLRLLMNTVGPKRGGKK